MPDTPPNAHEGWLDAWENDAQARDLSQDTISRYRGIVETFLDHQVSATLDLAEVDREHLVGHLEHLQCKERAPDTVLNHFTAINQFFEFLEWEDVVQASPVTKRFREHYLARYRQQRQDRRAQPRRRKPTTPELTQTIHHAKNTRDQAILLILAKTGLRRKGLVHLDVTDVDHEALRLEAPPIRKRSNTTVFFDPETRQALRHWLDLREHRANADETALFVSERGSRLRRNAIYHAVRDAATRAGVHDPDTDEDLLSPHSMRHWWTSTLLEHPDMPREYVRWLRGDSPQDAADLYHHINPDEVRRAYLQAIPTLGIF